MYRKTFHLKQHTPLIHFQHEQAGATLRATEVKPKLDRFLNEILREKERRSGNEAYEDQTFKYKLRIQQTASPDKVLIAAGSFNQEKREALEQSEIKYLDRTAYFALEKEIDENLFERTGETRTKEGRDGPREVDLYRTVENPYQLISKWGLLLDEGQILNLSIITSNRETLKLVNDHIGAFFICTNFGSRSTKGFGSFTIDGQSSLQIVKRSLMARFSYRFKYTNTSEKRSRLAKIGELFKWMQEDHRRLKSGQGHGVYRKSQTFLYGMHQYQNNQGFRWDKRYIKGNIVAAKDDPNSHFHANLQSRRQRRELTDEDGNNNQFNLNENFKFVRALLGLTEEFEFQTSQGRNNKYKVKVDGGNIDRYASPLIWKVIDYNIYLVAEEPNEEVRRATYNFSVRLGNNRRSVDFGPLHAPTAAEFRLGDFLDFAFDEKRPVNGDDDPNQPIYDYEKF